jgi:cyclophilin family peptidyl-prolyl cis-trans isomerase/protein-disulfide isomerase
VAEVETRLAVTQSESATPDPARAALIPSWPGQWSRGVSGAVVSFVLYTDFQCAYCGEVAEALQEVERLHPEDVRLTYRPLPQPDLRDKADLAAELAEAAGQQGSFWEAFELLYRRQSEWKDLSPSGFLEWMEAAAAELGMDAGRIRSEIEAGMHHGVIEESKEQAAAAGLPGSPILFFNQDLFRASPSLTNLEAAVRLALIEPRKPGAYPAFSIDPTHRYAARLVLAQGEIWIELDPMGAPLAVNSFVFLSRAGWFDGAPFHLVVPGRLAEAGDPSGTGLGNPGYAFQDEIDADLKFDREGLVAMASVGPDTNGSIFFVSLGPLPDLDGTRTLFGRVSAGLDILQALEARDPLVDLLIEPEAVIAGVEILEE